jgi:type II secretory pathway component GspD/PulD (secretin)
MTNDFNVMSGSFGGFDVWPFPTFDPIITGFDANGFPILANTSPVGWTGEIGNTWPDPDGSISGSSGITYDKNVLSGGTPFIGTPVPGVALESGMSLNLGLQIGESLLTGMFRLANEKNKVRTLSAPQITLANGQQGRIISSTQQYYISSYEVQDNVPVPQRSTAPTAISLTVRPVASEDLRYVFLELDPRRTESELRTTTTPAFLGVPGGDGDGGGAVGERVDLPIELPVQRSESLGTTVGVPDRGVVVVGGLSQSSRNQREAGVPILDKIPVIKRLFSGESRDARRNTLFVMARPQIIILSEEAQRMN